VRRAISLAVVAAMASVMLALPASATVHEIAGMHCAGEHANLFPRGISDPTKGNFAKPVIANGFVMGAEAYGGDGVNGPGMLLIFNFDHPASKFAQGPGDPVFVGGGTYIPDVIHDGPYTNCKELRP